MAFWNKDTTSTDWLAGVPFFEGFSAAELKTVAALGQETEAATGEILTDQGDVGQTCWVVVDGQASVYVGEDHIATVTTGTMIGEMSLLDRRPRSATVVADSAMKLLAFDVAGFNKMLDESPKARERVTSMLTARVRENNLN